MPCIDFGFAHATEVNQKGHEYYARTNAGLIGTAAVSMLAQLLAATGHDDVAVLYSAPLGGREAAAAFAHEAVLLGVRIRTTVEAVQNSNHDSKTRGDGDEDRVNYFDTRLRSN